jgi:hypothetical protein
VGRGADEGERVTTPTRKLDYAALRDRLTKGRNALQPRLKQDLIERAKQPAVAELLHATWEREKEDQLTADAISPWTERLCAQIASAWILTTLFVRVLEDRGFLRRKRLFGPEAEEARQAMVHLAPRTGARDYLLLVFQELQDFPAVKPLFDAAHNLAWRLSPSAELADALLAFWAAQEDLYPEFPFFRDATEGTAFMGDLYQDLDAAVRERYALWQTPTFVANFILDRTLTPALETFGLGEPDNPTRMIDPTCGSGHFLLLAFERLLVAWQTEAPGAGRKAHVERALLGVYGIDLNPYAVAIARFRLTVAALEAMEVSKLDLLPELPLNLQVADSLLLGVAHQMYLEAPGGKSFAGSSIFDLDDSKHALEVLNQGFHAVVGNPPYVTPKDKARDAIYREGYKSAAGFYALSAPFIERCFGLCVEGDKPGYLGLIVASSFMRRDFGRFLVEAVISKFELTQVVDTQGAHIPGHPTPTVILFGRRSAPLRDRVRTVISKRGEAGSPEEAAQGHVWNEIVTHADHDYEGDRVVSTELARSVFESHPWRLAAGDEQSLRAMLAACGGKVSDVAEFQGFGISAANGVFFSTKRRLKRAGVEDGYIRPLVDGELIRDWRIGAEATLFPYEWPDALVELSPSEGAFRYLWRFKSVLGNRRTSKTHGSYILDGLPWWKWHRVSRGGADRRGALCFAQIATHPHFSLAPPETAFNQVSNLVVPTTEDRKGTAWELLATSNSSVAAFWLRTECHIKGSNSGEAWEHRLDFAAKVLGVPRTKENLKLRCEFAQALHQVAMQLPTPRTVLGNLSNDSNLGQLQAELWSARDKAEALARRLVALQEELDWLTYRSYGLVDNSDCPTIAPERIPASGLELGHRPFEIVHAKRAAAGLIQTAWFERHQSNANLEVPKQYPESYRKILESRLGLIDKHPGTIALLEQPENKRRWTRPNWEGELKKAAWEWLLNELEADCESHPPRPWSLLDFCGSLELTLKRRAALELALGVGAVPSPQTAAELLRPESVPAAAALRCTSSGLTKHVRWREIWQIQTQEDAGEAVSIPRPPHYVLGDFVAHYWSCRGKLDVPKERFVLLPEASDDEEPGPLFFWAGWDQLTQARQISAILSRRLNALEGGQGEQALRLIPLFCALEELIFWVRLWWPEPDPEFGNVWAETFEEFIRSKLPKLGLPDFQKREDLAAWRPAKTKGRRKKASKPKAKKEPPERSAIEQALEDLGGEAKTADLAKSLGVTQKLLKAVTKPLEGEVFEVVKKRPLTYRLVAAGAAVEEGTELP